MCLNYVNRVEIVFEFYELVDTLFCHLLFYFQFNFSSPEKSVETLLC